jgi:DNA polymerase phi
MTDSEMMPLDLKLAEIFSQRKKEPNKRQEQKDAKENMVNFKSRVLDLLEIYVKKQASNPLAFDLIIPLLTLIRSTKTKQLADRAHGIISTFAKASKSMKENTVITTFDLLKLLKAIHLEAAKDPSHAYARAASSSSLLIASNIYRSDNGAMKKICHLYDDTRDQRLAGKIKIHPVFMSDFSAWCENHVPK